MFSRRWTLLVLIAWALLTGWFLLRDVRPLLHLDEPAPFSLNLGDEPRISLTGAAKQRLVEVPWQLVRNHEQRNIGSAAFRVVFDQWSDSLEIQSEFRVRSARRLGAPWLDVECIFRVDWQGNLHELTTDLRLRRESLLLTNPKLLGAVIGPWLPGLTEHFPQWLFLRADPDVAAGTVVGSWWAGRPNLGLDQPVVSDRPVGGPSPGSRVSLEGGRPRFGGLPSRSSPFASTAGRPPLVQAERFPGESLFGLYQDFETGARCRARVRNGSMLPQVRVFGEQREPQFRPEKLSQRGHVLVPFHPISRMPGLRGGQRWTVPLIDLEAAVNQEPHREVRQVVGEAGEAEPFPWMNRRTYAYPVTFSENGQTLMRLWVREQDLLVLRQEFTFATDLYTLERMPER